MLTRKQRLVGWGILIVPVLFAIAGVVCYPLRVSPSPENPTAYEMWFELSGVGVIMELVLLFLGHPYFGKWSKLWKN